MKINEKDIRLTNKKAIRLAKLRAAKEERSAANAAAISIIEHLSLEFGIQDTSESNNGQAATKIISGSKE
jgi:hypothetical protein